MPVLYFANLLREAAKVTKSLEAVEIKILKVSFWTKYRSIKNMEISPVFHILMWLNSNYQRVTTVTYDYFFRIDLSNNSKNRNITGD